MIRKIRNKSFKEIRERIDYLFGFGFLERSFYSNWFNPFLTLWLNLRSFPLYQAYRFPIFVYGRPRIYGLSGCMEIIGRVSTGMIKFNQTKPGAPSNMDVQSEIQNRGKIFFRGKGFIGTGTKINVMLNATLDLGENFKITDMCNVGCFSRILIGTQSRITHRCQILDANYHYVANFKKGIIPRWTHPIEIGRGCWICNTTTITGGTVLPDFTIVASNGLVGKDYSDIPESSMIGGIPAKLIATGFRKVENSKIECQVTSYYRENPDGLYHMSENETMDNCSFVNKFK